jgi:hypothetical protein
MNPLTTDTCSNRSNLLMQCVLTPCEYRECIQIILPLCQFKKVCIDVFTRSQPLESGHEEVDSLFYGYVSSKIRFVYVQSSSMIVTTNRKFTIMSKKLTVK